MAARDADSGDNGRVRYDLLRGNGDLFAVDPLTGAVTLRRSPRGLDSAFRLVVTAYDGGGSKGEGKKVLGDSDVIWCGVVG